MSAKISLVGNRFGMLEVVEELPRRPGDKQVRYLCKCDCGNMCETDAACLRGGKGSCGCIRRKRSKDKELREQKLKSELDKTKLKLKRIKEAHLCRFRSNWCKYSKRGRCCFYCKESSTCDEACKNTPDRCGHIYLLEKARKS